MVGFGKSSEIAQRGIDVDEFSDGCGSAWFES